MSKDLMNALPPKHLPQLSIVKWANVPFHERVVDRMANLLFDADDLLQMFEADRGNGLAWLEPDIRSVYDRVNQLMHKITD